MNADPAHRFGLSAERTMTTTSSHNSAQRFMLSNNGMNQDPLFPDPSMAAPVAVLYPGHRSSSRGDTLSNNGNANANGNGSSNGGGYSSSTMSVNSGYQSSVKYATTQVESTHHSPSSLHSSTVPYQKIEPGVYGIKNICWDAVVDLNTENHKSVIGFCSHRGANQEWEFIPLGKGWSIRSVSSGLYVTIERVLGNGNGIAIVANEFPVSWLVQPGSNGLYTFLWPNSESAWELQDGHGGTPVQLINRHPSEGHDYRLWRLDRLRPLANTTITDLSTHYSDRNAVIQFDQRLEPSPYLPPLAPPPTQNSLPSHRRGNRNRNRYPGFRQRPELSISSDSSEGSDSDASYTVVKSVTKTKTSRVSKGARAKKGCV